MSRCWEMRRIRSLRIRAMGARRRCRCRDAGRLLDGDVDVEQALQAYEQERRKKTAICWVRDAAQRG